MKAFTFFFCSTCMMVGIPMSFYATDVSHTLKQEDMLNNKTMSLLLANNLATDMNAQIKVSFSGTPKDLDIAWRKKIPPVVAELLTNTSMRTQSYLFLRLESALEEIDGKRLLSLTPAERERFVQSAIGENEYRALEDKFLKQITEGPDASRAPAAWALGHILFSSRAKTPLKEAVFSENRELQLNALQALSALGVPGADDLQTLFLLSGILPNTKASVLIEKANSVETRKTIGRLGLEILRAHKDNPLIAEALLPALQTRNDFRKIAADFLKNDVWRIPNEVSTNLEDVAREVFVSELIHSITLSKITEDSRLVDVLHYYANNTTRPSLFIGAMLYFERSGENEEFFKRLQKEPKNPPEKVQALSFILQRIQQNKRLCFEEEVPKPTRK